VISQLRREYDTGTVTRYVAVRCAGLRRQGRRPRSGSPELRATVRISGSGLDPPSLSCGRPPSLSRASHRRCPGRGPISSCVSCWEGHGKRARPHSPSAIRVAANGRQAARQRREARTIFPVSSLRAPTRRRSCTSIHFCLCSFSTLGRRHPFLPDPVRAASGAGRVAIVVLTGACACCSTLAPAVLCVRELSAARLSARLLAGSAAGLALQLRSVGRICRVLAFGGTWLHLLRLEDHSL